MLNLKTISISPWILAGRASLTNSGYNLYKNFMIIPNQNVEYNQALIEHKAPGR